MFVDIAVALSLVVAFLGGSTTVLDRLLMTDFIKRPQTVVFTSMSSTFLVTAVVFIILRPRFAVSVSAAPFIVLAGVLKSAPLFLYFRAVRMEDSTVIATVTNSGPLITVVLAFLFLGERLTPEQYVGVGLLVIVILLFGFLEGSPSVPVSRGMALAGVVTVLFAGQAILYKLALQNGSFWFVVLGVHAIAAVVGSLGLVQQKTRTELAGILFGDRPKALASVLLSEVLSSFSAIIKFAALSVGFVSIVAPVSAVSHLFVFVIVGVLSLVGVNVDTPTSRRMWVYRGVLAVLVFVGVLLVS